MIFTPTTLLAAWPITFLAWPFLLAALAAVIPVVLHMISRQRAKNAPFPTLRFLRSSIEKTRRRKRVQDLLLMLLRAALLILIALGLARPTVSHLRLLMGNAPSASVIILDNSASMGAVDQEQSRFDIALGAAAEILDELNDGDQVAMLTTNGPSLPELDHLDSTQEKIRQVLPQCRVSYERADLGAQIREARSLLAKSDAPNKQIYVLTDMQRNAWESASRAPVAEPEAAADPAIDAPLFVVDCSRTPRPNVAIHSVELKSAVPVSGVPVTISVDLWNTSETDQQRLVELVIEGTKEQTSPVLNVPSGGHLKHEFVYRFRTGGIQRGEVRLVGEDGSKMDDSRCFAIEVDRGIPVAIVKPERHEIPYLEDTFYLERALSPAISSGWAIACTALTAADLPSEPLEKFKVLFCVNLPAPNSETAQRLRAFVVAGGSLVWIAGDNVDPEAYNRMNTAAGGQLLPAPLVDVRTAKPGEGRDSWHIASLDPTNPVMTTLLDPPQLYRSVLVTKHVRMAIDKSPGAAAMARLDDGEPLLVERKVEQGRVLMLGTGAHVGWSNLPLRPIFLPLLVRLTFDLAGTDATSRELLAGAPLVLPLENQTQAAGIELRRPGGEAIRLHTEADKDKKGQVFRYADTHDQGVYVLRGLDTAQPLRVAFAVNADPAEPDAARIDRAGLEELLAPRAGVRGRRPERPFGHVHPSARGP